MRRTSGFAVIAALLMAAPVGALEKTSARAIDRGDDWSASSTLAVRYYNICTGWVWVWSGWSSGETMGVNFNLPSACENGPFLRYTWALTFSGVPSGYGFTGTIAVYGGQNCAAPLLSSQPYLPPVASGWNATFWGIPAPLQISVLIRWGALSGFDNHTGFASDHPLAGPTGPTSCGVCFPSTRVVRSRYYGVDGTYCPSGTNLSDGLCDVEFAMDAVLTCPVGVEDQSWGRVKNLYR